MSPRRPDPNVAFLIAVVGIALFSAMDATMKGLVVAIGTFATLFWRSVINVLISSVLYLPTRGAWPDRTTIMIHLIRALVIAATSVLFFWGLGRVPLAQGIALTFIAPLISIYLAAAFLGEVVDRRTVLSSLLGFAGVLVILAGQAHADIAPQALLGSAAIIAAAVFYAINLVLMRQQSLVAGPVEVGFFQNLTIAVLMLAALPVLGTELPTLAIWPFVVLASVLSTGSLMILSWAYARAGASYLANTEYTAFLWALLFGWLIFHEALSIFTLCGTVLIVGACIFVTRRRTEASPGLEAVA
jgi:S-adenosylmethionine uptake transporter